MSAVDALIETGRLVVCVGPGGVGKTTLAAALAVRAAALGRRAFVLTIDPAKRLASALGIEARDGVAVSVPVPEGSLSAAMLDPQRSYDALIARIANDGDRDRILDNRVYRAFSRTLARSHAYVAMEHLYDVLEGPSPPDLVILDTPPMRSALDALDAPLALARFAEQRSLGALAGSASAAGTYAAGKLVGLLAGATLGDELATFLRAFLGMRGGFAHRARAIDHILREEARFVLVVAPETTHLADAEHLADGLDARGIRVAATLANRAFTEDPRMPWSPMPAVALPAGASALVRRAVERAAALDRADRERMDRARALPGRHFFFPRSGTEPTDVGKLHALARAAIER